jgi:hypothetical protein
MRGIILAVIILFAVIYLFTETDTVTNIVLVVAFVATVLSCLLLEVMRLKTKVGTEAIHVMLKPLSNKQYTWSDIQSAEIIDYGFVGGWGIRIGTKYGTVYNARGSEGVWLTLESGKKIVIGTQRPNDWQKAIDKYLPKAP